MATGGSLQIPYNAKSRLLAGAVDLTGANWKVALVTGTNNLNVASSDTYANMTGEVATGNGYTQGGFVCTLSVTGSGATKTVSMSNVQFTASGGSITARTAVWYDSVSGIIFGWALLDALDADVVISNGAEFTLTAPNGIATLT